MQKKWAMGQKCRKNGPWTKKTEKMDQKPPTLGWRVYCPFFLSVWSHGPFFLVRRPMAPFFLHFWPRAHFFCTFGPWPIFSVLLPWPIFSVLLVHVGIRSQKGRKVFKTILKQLFLRTFLDAFENLTVSEHIQEHIQPARMSRQRAYPASEYIASSPALVTSISACPASEHIQPAIISSQRGGRASSGSLRV